MEARTYAEKEIEVANAYPGRDLEVTKKYKQMLMEVGFVDVQEQLIQLPIGPWPTDKKQKKMGEYGLANGLDGVEGVSMKFLVQGLGMSVEDVQQLLTQVRESFLDSNNKLFHNM